MPSPKVLVVELYDMDDKRNPYEGVGLAVGPLYGDLSIERMKEEMEGIIPDELNFIGLRFTVLPYGGAGWGLARHNIRGIFQALLGEHTPEPTRKKSVHVEQHFYLDFIKENGSQTVRSLALTFDVSEATAKRKLDGLVAQGKLVIAHKGHVKPYDVYGLPMKTSTT